MDTRPSGPSVPPRAPTVRIATFDGGLVEVILPARLDATALADALADAARLCRVAAGPARVLLDARYCPGAANTVARTARAWLATLGPEPVRAALALPDPLPRLTAWTLLLLSTRRSHARVFADRAHALRWLNRPST
jgi:hypothetical protein